MRWRAATALYQRPSGGAIRFPVISVCQIRPLVRSFGELGALTFFQKWRFTKKRCLSRYSIEPTKMFWGSAMASPKGNEKLKNIIYIYRRRVALKAWPFKAWPFKAWPFKAWPFKAR